MTPGDWNEANLSELPALDLLQLLGYRYVPPAALAAERASLKDSLLVGRLRAALRRLNPWISSDNLDKAVRAVADVSAQSPIEASQQVHTILANSLSLVQDLGEGKKGQDIRFFDFDHPRDNDLVVTRQYEVRGPRHTIIPDLVVFVNGLPLVVIECKSPTLGEGWREQAIGQLTRYQSEVPRLFPPVQILIGACGQAACYGTPTAPGRAFAEWKQPYPDSLAEVKRRLQREPTAQDILLWGTLPPETLLDLLRNFVTFEADRKSSRVARKLCRYQQYAAVNKALERARVQRGKDRGGVVWHSQGSGKSLTMLWLALKLRRDPSHDNPTLVIVTDRRDLDDQISGTFRACGFANPTQADSIKDLHRLLGGPGGATVLTTVQKFADLARSQSAARRPLSEAANLFVLTDEAHRTQYGVLAAGMRAALPNACFLGFTGTPIQKDDRSTLATFGPYIDKYTIEQSITDGATLPILYEGRMPALRIVGNTLDSLFDRVFADRSAKERAAIGRRYATLQTLAAAPRRIELICLDLIDHYTTSIQPNRFKGQIVACSRDVAVLYKDTLDALHGPQSAVIMSSSNDDDERLQRHHTSEAQRKKLIDRFLDPADPLALLIVCDMLITGFDAPVEQVLYLDAPLRDHTLLQAIARVNRTAEKKDFGLVVDYWGVSAQLQDALAVFTDSDVQGALLPKDSELPRLQLRHQDALRPFAQVKDQDDLSACLRVLLPKDLRAEFTLAFRRFSQSLDRLLPDTRALAYVDDLRRLGKIRLAAAATYRDDTMDLSDCGAKVRKLIEDAVSAAGIQVLVQRVALFSQDFDDKLAALRTPEAQASEVEHALDDEIRVKQDQDPAFYQSLKERLVQIIADREAQRIDAARQLELLDALRREAAAPGRAAQRLGLSLTGYAIWGLLGGAADGAAEAQVPYGKDADARVALAGLLEDALAAPMALLDWQSKDSVQRDMRRQIKRHLSAAGYPAPSHDGLAEAIVTLLKSRHGRGGPG